MFLTSSSYCSRFPSHAMALRVGVWSSAISRHGRQVAPAFPIMEVHPCESWIATVENVDDSVQIRNDRHLRVLSGGIAVRYARSDAAMRLDRPEHARRPGQRIRIFQ